MTRLRFLVLSMLAGLAALIPRRRYTVDQWCAKHDLILSFECRGDSSLCSLSKEGYIGMQLRLHGILTEEKKTLAKRKLVGRWHSFSKINPLPEGLEINSWDDAEACTIAYTETLKVYFPEDLVA